ncbi:lysophosphatidic acid receptor 3-like [Carcharodon carcharias]|uniref:lysophosphatidic acid receptor 3-like n=1 Tax=Carcharodon carcharias TaxID=13397 RepID=UPI001B7E0730|nr:lysophosphatidic acid receptor 3-like [Carcharodon carcharias]XP_041063469.1 lysophosphatidic acid receptor 3-like [Carcharodon carcharias]XP_041063470.1 lysophosphatidic acid receptor 3-like [Carcharodon carcharias]
MATCYYNETMLFFYNLNGNKSGSEDNIFEKTYYVGLGFGILCCLFIFLCNAMIIIAVARNRRFHFPFYYLLANLAAADIFASLAYVFLMFHTGHVSRTLTVHQYFLREALLNVSFCASLYSLLVIAVERYFSVMKMRLHSNLSERRVTCLVLAIWGTAIFMAAIPNMGWNCICNISTCSSLAPIYSRSFLIFWALFNLCTFFIIVMMYLRIYIYVRKKTLNLMSHTTGSIKRGKMPMKLIKTIVTVLGAFIFCWTPGLIVVLLDGIRCTSCNVLTVKIWVLLLALTNSLMNPIIYSYKDPEMWHVIKQMLFLGCGDKVEMDQVTLKSTSNRHSVVSEHTDLGADRHQLQSGP